MTWWSEMPTRFSLMAGLSSPSTSFCEAVVNSGRPAMGRYSWLRLGSLLSLSSAYVEDNCQLTSCSTTREEGAMKRKAVALTILTTGRIQGFALSSL
jgi:hypothetical protein